MKEFPDATVLFYAWGSFDKWCVFEGNVHNLDRAKPLRDIEYFKQIKWLAEKYSPDHVWENFKYLYNARADDMPEEYVCDRISDLAKNFPMNSLFADKLYTKLYKVAAEKAHYFSGGMEGGLMTCKMCMFVV